MDYYEYHELLTRWESLDNRLTRNRAKLQIRVGEASCDLDSRRDIINLIYHQAWVETNLRKNQPMRENCYATERAHLDRIEPDVFSHLEDCAPLVNNVSPFF